MHALTRTFRPGLAIGLLATAAMLGLLASPEAVAQNSVRSGEFEVHYSAIGSSSLAPEVARRYAITRSAARGLLNVAVLGDDADGVQQAVGAIVTGAATNLAGQRQVLAIREVREGSAIYYLAEPRVGDAETLNFELTVVPHGANRPIEIRFQQQFFAPR